MGLDPRGFMDGAFRGFQMMESYYDRQDRKQERTDGLRRADEINTENQRRYEAQIARQDERQVIEDQRYTENRTREDKNLTEEKAWRKQVHEDNQTFKGLRYATSGKKQSGNGNGNGNGNDFGKEYRGTVTELMTWRRDALSKLNPDNYDEGGYDAAVASIDKQYSAGMADINTLYSQSDAPTTSAPPAETKQTQAPYLSWTNNDAKKGGFISALKAQNIDVAAIPADKLTQMFEDNESRKTANARKAQYGSDAESLRQRFYKTQ
ncbi:hypothetical protein [Photobacterium toruni]|uniref:hypothetical protein n=1 Tax=Photobacterium toruni TaxID=1935446 RepID=UPI00210F79CD|nr:hypothetical protein [Photobacterium toruni]